ncbi:hypothetical protein BJ960_000016 [Leucobacter aridicollis]|uniref:O-antigen ligase domain-containing protein n=1 Tax=Leucobacter aridicollis TaxID=283878 RepID=A0A852QSQ4_9MICO|nr:hypothetical protein [Leucobacter aridicollis]
MGAIFAALLAVSVFRRSLFPWVFASSAAFPFSAAMQLGGNSLSPFHLAAALATTFLIADTASSRRTPQQEGRAGRFALGVFAVWASVVTLLAPLMFGGVRVLSARAGIDAAVDALDPLTYTVSTIAQLAYALLSVGAVLYLGRTRIPASLAFVPFGLGTVIAGVNYLCRMVGLPWPSELFDTSVNVIYGIAHYRGGVFNEPSELAGFSVASFALFAVGAFCSRGRRRVVLASLAVLAVVNALNSQAGTALASLFVVAALLSALAAWQFVTRGNGTVAMIILAGLAALAWIAWGDALTSWGASIFLNKLDSSSFSVRTASDRISLHIVSQTWGLGVGLGANRPSSFAAMMLSCTGVIGAAAFAVFLFKICATAMRSSLGLPAAWGLIAMLCAKTISLPDLTTPAMWVLIAACANSAWQAHEPLRTARHTQFLHPGTGESHGPQGRHSNSTPTVGFDPADHARRRRLRAGRHAAVQA